MQQVEREVVSPRLAGSQGRKVKDRRAGNQRDDENAVQTSRNCGERGWFRAHRAPNTTLAFPPRAVPLRTMVPTPRGRAGKPHAPTAGERIPRLAGLHHERRAPAQGGRLLPADLLPLGYRLDPESSRTTVSPWLLNGRRSHLEYVLVVTHTCHPEGSSAWKHGRLPLGSRWQPVHGVGGAAEESPAEWRGLAVARPPYLIAETTWSIVRHFLVAT